MSGAYSARVVEAIADIAAADWEACAGTANPFTTHAFLAALEDSGSVGADAGWLPHHLALEDAAGALVAVAPLYLKSHSFGEYVFDHAWADAYERAGGRYYPKLQLAVPFTPVTGPRLLARDEAAREALIAALVAVAERSGVSSLHVTFTTAEEWQRLGAAGFLQRTDRQFHWYNRGYESFDDFLAALSSRKRKAIRRERRQAAALGLRIETLRGDAIARRHWDAFFACYTANAARKWGYPYLTRRFFDLLGAALGERVVLMMAFEGATPVAAALNLAGDDALFGRYWGALGDYPFLHFELCYYRAIEYAIAHHIDRVEAGAQGPHKIARGYLPETTYSAHWIADERLREAVARFLDYERALLRDETAVLTAAGPFRCT